MLKQYNGSIFAEILTSINDKGSDKYYYGSSESLIRLQYFDSADGRRAALAESLVKALEGIGITCSYNSNGLASDTIDLNKTCDEIKTIMNADIDMGVSL
jgi:hypothetical protein